MTDNEKKSTKEIPWHPAFVVALQATLIDYKDVLEYLPEHPLNAEPLRIDIIVIKKRPEAVVKRQIAEIFRQENIFEYKNPKDSLSVNEFHKAFARANIYKALSNVDIAGLTLSFVVTAYPRELFRYLRETLGYAVDETHPGVHVVAGAMMPIQILISGKLLDEENIWLRNLNSNLPEKDLAWLSRLERKYGLRLDLSAYRYAVMIANQEKLSKEDYLMLTARTIKIFEEIGWTEKWRREGIQEGIQKGIQKGMQKGMQKGIQEGIQEGRLKDARAMLAEGIDIKTISRVTEIPTKTLKKKLSIK